MASREYSATLCFGAAFASIATFDPTQSAGLLQSDDIYPRAGPCTAELQGLNGRQTMVQDDLFREESHMTNESSHRLARDFFAAIGRGEITEDLVTPDFKAWVLSSGEIDLPRFAAGMKAFSAAVAGDLVYQIDSLTAENDRVVAEVHSDWALVNGERAQNQHVFVFTLRDGKVARMAEYMDPAVARDIIGPVVQQLMAQARQ